MGLLFLVCRRLTENEKSTAPCPRRLCGESRFHHSPPRKARWDSGHSSSGARPISPETPVTITGVSPFFSVASPYNFDFVEKLGFAEWILLSLRSLLLAVTLFPPLAGQVNQKKDKGQRTKEKGEKTRKCESIIL
jgi:hypothetical protein